MNEEEKKAIETVKQYKKCFIFETVHEESGERINDYSNSIDIVVNLLEKQQKEIEELSAKLTTKICKDVEKINDQQKEIEYLKGQIPQDKIFYYSEKEYISKDKIKKILGIDEDFEKDIGEYDEEKILYLLQTIVAEFNRLEGIEDRKVQVAVDFIESKRDKYWQEKIKNKIKELKKMKLTKGDIFFKMRNYAILILRELLEE